MSGIKFRVPGVGLRPLPLLVIALALVVVIFVDRNSLHPSMEPSYDLRVYGYAHDSEYENH